MMAAALALALSATPLKAAGGPAPAPLARVAWQVSADDLVKQLGSDDPKTRDAAQAALEKLGDAAEAALRGAAKSDDLEVKGRACVLLRHIEIRRQGFILVMREIPNSAASALVRIVADGSDPVMLLPRFFGIVEASPDGRRLACCDAGAHSDELWVMDIDGRSRSDVIKGKIDSRRIFSVSWSPDASRLLIRCDARGAADRSNNWASRSAIYVLELERGEVTKLSDCESDGSPTWSPDGRTIAFVCSNEDRDRIRQVDLKGGEPTLIATVTNSTERLSWSPDGRRLSYWTLDDRHWSFRFLPAGGGAIQRFDPTRPDQAVLGGWWLPDGRRFQYLVSDVSEDPPCFRPYVLDVETWKVEPMATPPGLSVDAFVMSPDGKRAAFVSGQDLYASGADFSSPQKIDAGVRSIVGWVPSHR